MALMQAAVLALSLSGTPGGETVLLDFYADWCGPCQQMHPVVDRLAAMGYPVKKVNVDQNRALASKFGVNPIPCFVMLVNGRVVDRAVGAQSFERLEAMCKAGATSQAAPSAVAGNPTASVPATPTAFPARPADSWQPEPRMPAAASGGSQLSDEQLIAVSVRLRIRDASGNSCGSGTIVDARDGEALILTCGHIFRDSQGKGPIEVDLFGPAPARGIEGRLIAYDLKNDVGLVAIHTPSPMASAKVAPPDYRVSVGDRVTNVGCNNGDDPTVRHSRVTALDKYLGPPNVEVAGVPVEGRSGGGLFSEEGYVIGVCNAADPADNEGLYAALRTICEQLDRAGLAFVYNNRSEPAAVVASADPPVMPKEMPSPNAMAAVAVETPAPPHAEALRSDEAAALEEIQRRRAEGAEVICVIRSMADPNAPSEILMLDHASPGFLRQLASEAEAVPSERMHAMNSTGGRLLRPVEAQTTSARGEGTLPLYDSSRMVPVTTRTRSDWEPRWLEPTPAGN